MRSGFFPRHDMFTMIIAYAAIAGVFLMAFWDYSRDFRVEQSFV